MANPSVTNDIAQTLAAELRARALYDDAGFHRNYLEQKAKKGDQAAKAELPEAQQKVEQAQEDLKRIQTRLAALTGTDNPHAKQTVARATPEDLKKYHATKKSAAAAEGPKKAESVHAELVTKMTVVERPLRAAYIETFIVHDFGKTVDLKQFRKSLEEFLKQQPKDFKHDLKKVPAGEMIRKIEIPRELFQASLMEFYRAAPVAGEFAQRTTKKVSN